MFREDNHIYYRTDNGNYNHNVDVQRNKKTKELIEEKESDIRMFQCRMKNIKRRKLQNMSKPSDDKQYIAYKNKIRKLQNEIDVFKHNSVTHKIKRSKKKLSSDKIYTYCIKAVEDAKENNISHLRAEDIAFQLNTHVHLVKQAFARLNQEGILAQATHCLPHDCFRPDYSCWSANVYYIR